MKIMKITLLKLFIFIKNIDFNLDYFMKKFNSKEILKGKYKII